MNLFVATLLSPLLGGLLLALVNNPRLAARINVGTGITTFTFSLLLVIQVLDVKSVDAMSGWFHLDAYNVFLLALTTFVGMTTSIFSAPYMRHELASGHVDLPRLRLYHSMFQLFQFGMLLGFSTNNIGVLWVSLELATLATVLLVSLYRTPASIAAAWKYFILCGMGIALALFGTVLVFFTSSAVLGHGNEALNWTALYANAARLDPAVMSIAFCFLMVGYGTKVGLVPMHAWLPDAHGEGPTPVSAVLSGLLLNLALYALVRCKMLVDGSTGTDMAGHIMMGFGLLSLFVAAFSLHKQRDIKRMFSFSSIEHMGLMTFAFGIGSSLASFAALLHMTVHSLVKSGIFFTVGHAAQAMGTQKMAEIRGLIRHHPGIGWGLLMGTVAIAGFPPFGVFTSEFLLFAAALEVYPWTAVPLLLGLLIAMAGLFRFVQPMVYGEVASQAVPVHVNMLPVYVHFAMALVLGLAIPDFLADWYTQAAALIVAGGGGG
ncbi:MAG: hydrogenase 4 subunit F [Zetaproteobacteria bacterium CG_4_9_14_3_um_filter_49_83]|nr:MAG: hydrogenase 4 subunit F [Zetaproteobacteria bacterium CG1_02_49_23]PIQ30122.1 MAG: hydrogenase 4 subunit F [Zetaproteobacteria bacterium CG17_big_fil_post_rev_8_21_14_2_50_50_13]PIV31508.1 MAG: hydrogenase 4 subunit F [Zetaproteobacteria bacterium CG02_land_8_20_14_3_00_50_9]PIY55930.1 MAG: hydrogenase 4 subunit F [Zetaproteobacteria bacterium CG_4_10_14_0_8_um_filter_49_80]PJA36393.1 MAG: hydrogenase 4 subunit F [Zetaproteobacteria bacterium CG_4_9_14_3_um_filter_49_83]